MSFCFCGVKAHRPTRLWQSVHWTIVFSFFWNKEAGSLNRGGVEPDGESGTENEERRDAEREGEPWREADPTNAEADMKGLEGVPALEAETEADLDTLRDRSFAVGGTRLQPNTDARMAASDSVCCRESPSTSMASSSLSFDRDTVFLREASWLGVRGCRMLMSLTKGSRMVAFSFSSLTVAVGV